MFEFYSVEYSITDTNSNKKLANWYRWHDICTDKTMNTEVIELTWDNLQNVAINDNLNPHVKQKKKGKLFEFHESMTDVYYKYKQWKRPKLDLQYQIIYHPVTKSIKKVLEYQDAAVAIRYLVERGVNIKIGAIIDGIR